MTANQMEILEATAKKVSEMVESAKAQVNLLTVIPGGIVTSEMADQIDKAAEIANGILADIDTEVTFLIPMLKNLSK